LLAQGAEVDVYSLLVLKVFKHTENFFFILYCNPFEIAYFYVLSRRILLFDYFEPVATGTIPDHKTEILKRAASKKLMICGPAVDQLSW
jgi:hypothetical protein